MNWSLGLRSVADRWVGQELADLLSAAAGDGDLGGPLQRLPLLFEQWADPIAVHMAAFTAPDHMDGDAFERRWSRLQADETVLVRVIVVDDEVAGTIGSWGESGEREVTYWIGRSCWGMGIVSDALAVFLAVERSRPLHARVAEELWRFESGARRGRGDRDRGAGGRFDGGRLGLTR